MNDLSIQRIINYISEVIRQPELHMREIPILVGLAILIIFIFLVILALLLVRPSKKYVKKIPPEKLKQIIKRRYIAAMIFCVLVVIPLVLAAQFDSKKEFCLDCHEMKQAANRLPNSVHKGISCIACHQGSGLIGVMQQKFFIAEMMIARSKVVGDLAISSVSNDACLKCHQLIKKGPLISGAIRVEHKHPLDKGFKCTDCHFERNLFHVKIPKLEQFSMSNCIECHNERIASSDCNVCHMRNIVGSKHVDHSNYSKAEMPDSITCKSCHSLKQCLDCHKVQVPHQQNWSNGGHALNAFKARGLCMECHGQENCLKCHVGIVPHGDNWLKQHGPKSRKTKDACSRCHENNRFCALCHDNTASFTLKNN